MTSTERPAPWTERGDGHLMDEDRDDREAVRGAVRYSRGRKADSLLGSADAQIPSDDSVLATGAASGLAIADIPCKTARHSKQLATQAQRQRRGAHRRQPAPL